ncbi:RNA-guided endonuclease InsQ/TnpB family protein, partial [Robertmurraya sp.]|uniref:RNA-guided endonuclease InsQ/TnpB family protein n=1 Tax=Robertmurraya sp. TaxID=2837525 RepID=UPI0037042087
KGMGAKKSKRNVPTGDVLVSKIPLRLTAEQRLLVDHLRQESARLWNDILDHHGWLWQTWKVWTNEAELKKWFNSQDYALHSQTIQAIVELHQETCQRTYEQRVNGNKDWKYPWRYKKYFSVRYKKAAIHNKGDVLKFSNGLKEKPLVVKCPKHIDPSVVKHAEIVWHLNQYWLHLTIEKPKRQQVQGTGVAGGDPGEIHALTLSDGKQHVILTGKELRSLHRLRNKKLAWFQNRISRTQKGSSHREALIERKRNFLAWINRRIEYVEHAISKQAIHWCMDHGIQTVYIGNPDGVQRNTKKKRSRVINQKLSQWSFGELFRKIRYKGRFYGIQVEKICPLY